MAAHVNAQEILDRYRPLVDAEIERAFRGRADFLLYRMIRYHLGLFDSPEKTASVQARAEPLGGGKRVRSTLCLLACQAVGGRPEEAAPAGAGIELLHNFTLLHDDIADQDEMRRGRPTVWRHWGIGQAITAGDAMYALANLEIKQPDAPGRAEIALAVMRELNEATLTICEGQQLDLSFEGRQDLRIEDYLDMISRKTAALFVTAVGIGARIGGASEDTRLALNRFGRHLGLAYQIRDDVLGIWGEEDKMGKPVGGDLRRNKRSLPVLYALSLAEQEVSTRIREHLSRGVADDRQAAMLAVEMEQAGAKNYCDKLAQEQLARAFAELNAAPLVQAFAEELRTLSGYLVARNK